MKLDGRKLSHTELTEMRRRAVSSVQGGERPADVARVFGVSRVTVYNWLSLYRQGGWDALQARKRGGRKPKLDGKAMRWVYSLVTGGDPRQLKLPFVLWTCPIIADAIREKFDIKLSRWSVMRLLNQLGLSPQRPIRRAYQQNAAAVKRWRSKVYPQIRKEAKIVGAQIHFADESSIRSDYHSGTTWAPRGKTPVVRTTGSRFSINMIASVTPRGQLRFMTFKGTMNAAVFIDFLERLIQGVQSPIFLIVDGHPVHRSKAVKAFVDGTDGKLSLYFLPGYSPELNPVEQAWNHAKRHTVGRQAVSDQNELRKLIQRALWRLQNLPRIIVGFFKHPECQYAADC